MNNKAEKLERFNAALLEESTEIAFTQAQAARIYGCTDAYIQQLLKSEKLKVVVKDGRNKVSALSLKKLIEEE